MRDYSLNQTSTPLTKVSANRSKAVGSSFISTEVRAEEAHANTDRYSSDDPCREGHSKDVDSLGVQRSQKEGMPSTNGCSKSRVESELRRRLRVVLDKAPSDSSAVFYLRNGEDGYKALLKIHSRDRKFIAGAVHRDFVQVVDEVIHQIRYQLCVWRQERFVDN